MHAKVIQIQTEPIDNIHMRYIDALDLDVMNDRDYEMDGKYAFDYSMDWDWDEYDKDLKGFLSYLSDNDYATVYFSDDIRDINNYFTVSDGQAEKYLEEEGEISKYDSPPIYVAKRISTYDEYRIYSLSEWMRYVASDVERYYIGPIMDVHN